LAVGLRELFILGEDYINMFVCQDIIDAALLSALSEAGRWSKRLKKTSQRRKDTNEG